MATFAVHYQQYPTGTAHTVVMQALSEQEATSKADRTLVTPDEFVWCTTEEVIPEEWDIPFFTTGSNRI